jgi:hypothetical protein
MPGVRFGSTAAKRRVRGATGNSDGIGDIYDNLDGVLEMISAPLSP